MKNITITKEQLLFYLFNENYVGKGQFGIVHEYDKNTLIKIYYKDVFNTYITKNILKLDEEIYINKMLKNYNVDSNQLNEKDRLKLEKLYELNLINGIILYQNYHIGTLIPYYQDYKSLTSIVSFLTKEELLIILRRVQEYLDYLINNNIYPTDIREDNILIRINDLDVKIIDLDDEYTKYEENEYVKKHLYMKENSYENIKYLNKKLI